MVITLATNIDVPLPVSFLLVFSGLQAYLKPVEEDAALCQTTKSLVRSHSSYIIFRHKTIGR
jgi:hypothetical protein